MQAAAANSAAASMEAATAKKMMADFRAAITAQVAMLEERLGVDAAQLTQVTITLFLLLCVERKKEDGQGGCVKVTVLKCSWPRWLCQGGCAKLVVPSWLCQAGCAKVVAPSWLSQAGCAKVDVSR